MMKTPKTKIPGFKIYVAALSLFSIMALVACQDQFVDEAVDITRNSSMVLDMPKVVSDKLAFLKERSPGVEFIVLEMNEEGKKKFKKLSEEAINRQQTHTLIEGISVMEKDNTLREFVILSHTTETQRLAELSSTNEVFTIVDQPASPVFGIEKYFEGIAQNLRYPENARRKGIEGRVFIEFIVNKDGSLSDYKIAKGFDEECDAEAMRTVMLSQPWYPAKASGKIVRQRMVLPITFKLG